MRSGEGSDHVRQHIGPAVGRVGHQYEVAIRIFAHALQGIVVLGDHDERGGFLTVDAYFIQYFYALFQSARDLAALVGDPLPLQALALRLGFSASHDADALRLGIVLGGGLVALGGVDAVHGDLHFLIGVDVGHKGLDDDVAVIIHALRKLTADGHGDIVFANKYIIQLELRHFGAHHIEDVGGDLLLRVFELVKSIVHRIGQDAVLHRNAQTDEHVILSFGLHLHVELLNLETNFARDGIDEGDFEIQATLADTVEFAKALNDGGRLLLDGEYAGSQYEQADHQDSNK